MMSPGHYVLVAMHGDVLANPNDVSNTRLRDEAQT